MDSLTPSRSTLRYRQAFDEHPNLIDELREMSSENVLETLQRFNGIGIWSVSIFALF